MSTNYITDIESRSLSVLYLDLLPTEIKSNVFVYLNIDDLDTVLILYPELSDNTQFWIQMLLLKTVSHLTIPSDYETKDVYYGLLFLDNENKYKLHQNNIGVLSLRTCSGEEMLGDLIRSHDFLIDTMDAKKFVDLHLSAAKYLVTTTTSTDYNLFYYLRLLVIEKSRDSDIIKEYIQRYGISDVSLDVCIVMYEQTLDETKDKVKQHVSEDQYKMYVDYFEDTIKGYTAIRKIKK